MKNNVIVIPKVWRSELKSFLLFIFFSFLALYLSKKFPGSVLSASIWEFNEKAIYLWLPLWWFLPAVTILFAIIRIYDVRYRIDQRGLEMRIGILSFHQRINRLRFEDIRNIEIEQTLVQRMLNIGRLEVSTAATGTIEIIMEGIEAPDEVRSMLEREREQRQQTHYNKLYDAKDNDTKEEQIAAASSKS